MNRKKIFLTLFLVSVMSLSQVYADFDYADSPEFQLDLLTFPLGGAYDYSDSLQFGLDLYPVNRDWADSAEFGYNYGDIWQPGGLEGTVTNYETGEPVAYADVSLIGEDLIQTDEYGDFVFDDPAPGTKTLTITKTGYYTIEQQVTIQESSGQLLNVVMTPESAGTDPVVVSIESQYSGQGKHVYYIDGISLNQTFTATIDWKGHTPGTVYFNGIGVAPSGNKASYSINVGTNLGVGGKLNVYAQASGGATSATKQANFDVIDPPPGIPLGLISKVAYGNSLSYYASFSLGLVDEGVDNDVIPDDIPGFGGRKFAFKSIVTVKAHIGGDGTASASLSPDYIWPSTKIAGIDVGISGSVGLKWEYSSINSDWIPGGQIEFSMQGSYDTPPSYYVIPVGPVPVPVYWRMGFEAALATQLAVGGWGPGGDIELSGEISPSFGAEIMLGVGAADLLAVEGYLGGTASMLIAFPNAEPLQQITIELDGGIRLVVWVFKYEKPLLHYEWYLYEAQGAMTLGLEPLKFEMPQAEEFEPMGRNYINREYSVWRAPKSPETQPKPLIMESLGAEVQGAGGDQPQQEQLLQSNVFPRSTPALATEGNDLYLAWIYDDPNRDPGDANSVNRTEVVFAKYQSGFWSEPNAIDDDNTADFSPRVVTLSNGDAICVWENANTHHPNTADLTDMAASMEIEAAYYNSASGSWTSQSLTNNSTLDRSPRIAAGLDDSAMLVWIANSQNDILGGDPNFNEIKYSIYNGSTWSGPNTVATGIGAVLKTSLDYDGSDAVYVFTIDEDANMVTEDDRELYSVTYNSSSGWSATSRLTNDSILDATPQVKLTGSGNLLLVWYRDPNIVSSDDLALTDIQTIFTTSQSTGVTDFKLARSTTGQLSIAWTEPSQQGGVDTWTAGYDSTLSIWSKLYQLTSDYDMEHSLSPAFDANGTLNMAYNKVNIIDNNGIPAPSTVDLYILQHAIEGDLTVSAETITVSEPNAMPGATIDINAVIVNSGSIAEVNIPVAFYNGNPQASGALIGNDTVSGPLAAADSAIVSTNWQVPEVNNPIDLYVVVDPNYTIEDVNRSNNTASTKILLPDLTIDEVHVQKTGPKKRAIIARIANYGPTPVVNISAVLRLDSPEGMPIASFQIPDIQRGGYQDVSFEWDISGKEFSVAEAPIYMIVDLNGGIEEFNEDNNILLAQVGVTNIADFSDNGEVDTIDLAKLVEEWLETEDLSTDISPIDGDGIVNFMDFAKFAANWLDGVE